MVWISDPEINMFMFAKLVLKIEYSCLRENVFWRQFWRDGQPQTQQTFVHESLKCTALPYPFIHLEARGVIMVKCLTQGHNTLAVTELESTTFCLWAQHWSARPQVPKKKKKKKWLLGFGFILLKHFVFDFLISISPVSSQIKKKKKKKIKCW